jgi:hypothetical protein
VLHYHFGRFATTFVTSVPLLLLEFGSLVNAATEAVFVSVFGASFSTVTTILTVALAPLGRIPRSHLTVLVPEQLPMLGVAETNVTPDGKRSVTDTPLVVAGPVEVPLFVTTRW